MTIRRTHRGRIRGFTLVEIMLSVTVLAMLMLILVAVLDQTSRIWKRASQKIDAFRESRSAFEAVTRKIAQATLNTYWDYDDPKNPRNYVRKSELRFISGRGTTLTAGAVPRIQTHALFFQAPLGIANSPNLRGMETLLNTVGFYVAINSDETRRPAFLSGAGVAPRVRFRLMEMIEPSDSLVLYNFTSPPLTAANQNPPDPKPYNGYRGKEWFTIPLALPANNHPLAENVIALILEPKLSQRELLTGELPIAGPDYSFDSALPAGQAWPPNPLAPYYRTLNQLPPLIQVTMVAIDEVSASRLNATGQDPAAALGLPALFLSAANYQEDLRTLEERLVSLKLTYRIFTSEVIVRGAKWSRT